MINRICPECGKYSIWKKENRKEKIVVKGEKILVDFELLICENCSAEFEDFNSDYDPYAIAYEEYRKIKGMIHPKQLIEFREKFNFSQRELSELVGLGVATISRYENGALQDRAHDQLLQFAMKSTNLQILLEKNKKSFSKDKYKKISRILEKENVVNALQREMTSPNEPDIFTGNKPFSVEKTIGLIKFFTYPTPVVKSKLLKLMFYADFGYYKRTGYSISGLKYAHLPYGPVPYRYDLLLGFVQDVESKISIETVEFGNNYIGELFGSEEPPNYDLFTEAINNFLTEVNNYFSSFNAKQIEEFSHHEMGYESTKMREIIPYSFAEKLQI